MSGISGVQSTPYPSAATSTPNTGATPAAQTDAALDIAATYEKGEETNAATYTRDRTAIRGIRAQERAYIQSLQNLVTQLVSQVNQNNLSAGGGGFRLNPNKVDSYWDLMVDNGDGTFSFHPDLSPEAQDALIARAKEDIGEDGYYGVKQTSQRILDFAKAITGGDPSKIEDMRKYIQKGFDEVEKMFGGKLPEISYQTLNAVMKGLDEWAAGAK
ncbi:MAG: hypothetical protein FWG72_07960 [Oscillospiraceae bacterium]|nr:hypothetical protein [Oscillospiraceae bacterium]